jgi:hypothetical protein
MANDRGQYGKNGETRVGATVYVERKSSSIVPWIVGTIAVGGVVLWARHQSKQIEQLYKTAGLPQQSFGADLRQSAKALPARTSAALRGLAERVQPTKKSAPPATKVITTKSET